MEQQKLIYEASAPSVLSREFLEVLARWLGLFGQHYQQAIDEMNVYAYRIGLQDLSAEILDKACAECLKRCEFIPKVADIRGEAWKFQTCNEITRAVGESMYEKTMNWLRVTDGFPGGSKEELPPIAEYAMKCAGGRDAMLSGVDADREWAHKHFVEHYEKTYSRLKEAGVTTRDGAREALGMWSQGKPVDFKQLQAGVE